LKEYTPTIGINTLPEWFLILRNDAMLSSKSVAELFGFKDGSAFQRSSFFKNGFPPPDDKKYRKIVSYNQHGANFWSKRTIINFLMQLEV
jgi:hypothetical protein